MSRPLRAATFCWIAASIAWTAALVAEHENPVAIALVPVIGVGLVVLSRRRKAAVAPGAFYASSADLVDPATVHRRQLPGELSFTDTAIHWNPSRYSIGKGARPITVELAGGPDVVFEAGPGLATLFLRIHRLDGSELTFVTHRTRRLRAARERLTELGRTAAPDR